MENLLNGAIGSIIGVIGAVLVAYWTVERSRRDQAAMAISDRRDREAQAQREHQIAASGVLAYHLVELYDELKAVQERGEDPDVADLSEVRQLGRRAARSIVVDAPLMTPEVARKMKLARKDIATLTSSKGAATSEELGQVRASVREAAESLRNFRKPVSHVGAGAIEG